MELDVYTQAMATQRQQAERLDAAHRQQLERLRYEAALCERQFRRVDPDNRLVTAELERRWEAALRELTTAEAAYAQRARSPPERRSPLAPELRAAFLDIGRTLPDLWQTEVLSQAQRKALLRCLIDKVVVHRSPRGTRSRPVLCGKAGRRPPLRSQSPSGPSPTCKGRPPWNSRF